MSSPLNNNDADADADPAATLDHLSPSPQLQPLFSEPAEAAEAEKKKEEEEAKRATFIGYTLRSGQTLELRLGHLLWNASRVATEYLEEHADELVRDKTVLEFGAGAGLPSLACALAAGARTVVVTDYPDEELVQNLRWNIEHAAAAAAAAAAKMDNIFAEGYVWGASTSKLTAHLDATTDSHGGSDSDSNSNDDSSSSGSSSRAFDLLILADLLFNHSEQGKLVSSVSATLKRAPWARALVFFTPHRPWLLERDMAFFDLAREAGFVVEKVLERRLEHAVRTEGGPVSRRSVYDDDNDGAADGVKKVVFGYQLRWGA